MIRNQAIKYLKWMRHELRSAKLARENDTLNLQKVQRTCFLERSETLRSAGVGGYKALMYSLMIR
jgi:hypothetical protein